MRNRDSLPHPVTLFRIKRKDGNLDECGPTGEPSVKTKGELEAEVSNAVMRFKREYMGRGPQDVRTHLIDDMVLVRLKGRADAC